MNSYWMISEETIIWKVNDPSHNILEFDATKLM